MGNTERASLGQRRKASGRGGGRSSDRIRHVRRSHSQGTVWRGDCDGVGPGQLPRLWREPTESAQARPDSPRFGWQKSAGRMGADPDPNGGRQTSVADLEKWSEYPANLKKARRRIGQNWANDGANR